MRSSLGEASVSNINDWLQKYAKFSKRLFLSGRTLDDQQNPLFLGKNVELSSTFGEGNSKTRIFGKTGFVCVSIQWPDKIERNSLDSNCEDFLDKPVGSEKFSFLSDWERLWNFFDEEDSDEIAVQLPFLRVAMEFIFHPNIVQLVQFLFFWNISVALILQGVSRSIPDGIIQSLWLNCVFEIVVYDLLCLMYKGPSALWICGRGRSSIFPISQRRRQQSQQDTTDSVSSSPSTPTIGHQEAKQQEVIDQPIPFWATLRRVWDNCTREFYSIFKSDEGSKKINKKSSKTSSRINTKGELSGKTDKNRSLYYYRWINIALKVLTRDYGVNIREMNFNRSSYRFLLTFAFVGYPIYVIIMFYVKVGGLLTGFCSSLNYKEDICQFYLIELGSTGMGLSLIVSQYFYGASVLLSLAGLAYGGEIAFRLAECWTTKFQCLRRLEIYEDENEKGREDEKEEGSMREDRILLPEQVHELQELICRDATEHYLFVCALLHRAGNLWSPVLLLFLFLAIYIALANVLILLSFSSTSETTEWYIILIIFITIRVTVLAIYPVLSIAFANANFIEMSNIFRIADDNDYALIGGRNRWLNVFKDAPAAWTIFGVFVTPQQLFAVLWTALLAIGGVLITTIAPSTPIK
jgi:hypothetical protein